MAVEDKILVWIRIVPEFERQRYSNNALETRRQTGLNDKTKGAYGKGENGDAGISRFERPYRKI
jgi:hypothetical protein